MRLLPGPGGGGGGAWGFPRNLLGPQILCPGRALLLLLAFTAVLPGPAWWPAGRAGCEAVPGGVTGSGEGLGAGPSQLSQVQGSSPSKQLLYSSANSMTLLVVQRGVWEPKLVGCSVNSCAALGAQGLGRGQRVQAPCLCSSALLDWLHVVRGQSLPSLSCACWSSATSRAEAPGQLWPENADGAPGLLAMDFSFFCW